MTERPHKAVGDVMWFWLGAKDWLAGCDRRADGRQSKRQVGPDPAFALGKRAE